MRAVLPRLTRRLGGYAFLLVNLQAALGISTLLYLVPIPVAAAHQAGSVALLTSMLALAISLRRPSAVAQMWRRRFATSSATAHKL
jgi:cytochrome c oxidase assembly protein subunit 15